MTTTAKPSIGAASTSSSWDTINWRTIKKHVQRLQMRIAKATREGRWGKVKALQWLLTHAFSAKLLAVRRVVSISEAEKYSKVFCTPKEGATASKTTLGKMMPDFV
jgi:RNA-directed DNA polymerase